MIVFTYLQKYFSFLKIWENKVWIYLYKIFKRHSPPKTCRIWIFLVNIDIKSVDILLVIYGWVSSENCLFWAKKSEKYCNQVSARQSSTREESILPEKPRIQIITFAILIFSFTNCANMQSSVKIKNDCSVKCLQNNFLECDDINSIFQLTWHPPHLSQRVRVIKKISETRWQQWDIYSPFFPHTPESSSQIMKIVETEEDCQTTTADIFSHYPL